MANTDPILPENFNRLLLVEGEDDKSFFLSLAKELELNEAFWIYEYQGKDQLDKVLTVLINDTRFEELMHVGIVRDADFNTDAFSSVCSRINRANRINPQRQLPVPDVTFAAKGTTLKSSVLILPEVGIEGMLEDLVLNSLAQDPTMSCVESFFSCVEDVGIQLRREVLPKAKARIFVAGKACDGAVPGKDDWELQHIFNLSWWNWDNPVFDNVKAFLYRLATE